MRAISIIATMGVLVFAALTLVPGTSAYHAMLSIAALICAALALIAIVATRHREPAATDRRAPAEAPRPPSAAQAANRADAEVVNFLATMQQRGRLVDFLMDDITAFSDAQVGAAARVVHGGCGAVLKEYVRIRPVREENEGAAVEVPDGYFADEYRLVGTVRGSPPFTGVLVHRGWRVEEINLPRLLRPDEDRLPTIAPAEVELK